VCVWFAAQHPCLPPPSVFRIVQVLVVGSGVPRLVWVTQGREIVDDGFCWTLLFLQHRDRQLARDRPSCRKGEPGSRRRAQQVTFAEKPWRKKRVRGGRRSGLTAIRCSCRERFLQSCIINLDRSCECGCGTLVWFLSLLLLVFVSASLCNLPSRLPSCLPPQRCVEMLRALFAVASHVATRNESSLLLFSVCLCVVCEADWLVDPVLFGLVVFGELVG
jgi:hypothetical protein